jgi:hypothetical protein
MGFPVYGFAILLLGVCFGLGLASLTIWSAFRDSEWKHLKKYVKKDLLWLTVITVGVLIALTLILNSLYVEIPIQPTP